MTDAARHDLHLIQNAGWAAKDGVQPRYVCLYCWEMRRADEWQNEQMVAETIREE